MGFKDLREFTGRQSIDLPIDGTPYKVWGVDAETGIWAQALFDAGITVYSKEEITEAQVDAVLLDDDAEPVAYRRLLGDAYDEMLTNGVDWDDLKHAAMTALVWIVMGREQAEEHWASAGEEAAAAPKSGPNRGSRRASAAVARTTRKRASTSGTKASTGTSSKAAASAGRKSSNSGPSSKPTSTTRTAST